MAGKVAAASCGSPSVTTAMRRGENHEPTAERRGEGLPVLWWHLGLRVVSACFTFLSRARYALWRVSQQDGEQWVRTGNSSAEPICTVLLPWHCLPSLG